MEGEVNNFILIWSTALASLVYCHKITKVTAQGTTRLCAFIPIFCIFFYLPLLLTTVHLSGSTSFFITWLATFKLLLLAFDKGPLFSNPPLPFSKFILAACVPIKIIEKPNLENQPNGNKSPEITGLRSDEISKISESNGVQGEIIVNQSRKGNESPLKYLLKLIVFLLLIKVCEYNEHLNPLIKMALLCVRMYIVLDLGLAMVAYLARAMIGVELEPQFNEPYLTTSLQDFWGKRWNLMVTGILHPTVYLPVRSLSGRFLPKKLATVTAVFASFLVSGLMHELIFYYIGRLRPTWEVTWFFVIHGVLVGAEVVVKRAVNGRFRLPPVVSGAAAAAAVMATSFWLFFPPYLRCNTEVRSCKEFVAFLELVMHWRFVSPNDVSCPFF